MNPLTRVLVTGGSGFVGTNLVAFLRAQKDTVQVLSVDINPPRVSAHRDHWRSADVRDARMMAEVFTGFSPDLVVHLAARTDLAGRTLSEYDANTEGTRVVLETIAAHPSVRKSVFASSRLVCRVGYDPRDFSDYCPPNFYGESKVVGENLVRACGPSLNVCVVRPTSLWGPYFATPYREFFDAVRKRRFLAPRGRTIEKSFGYVENSVYQLWKLLAVPTCAGETLYLCDYDPIEISAFAHCIAEASEVSPPIAVPHMLLGAAGLVGTGLQRARLVKEPPLTMFRYKNLMTRMLHDTTRLHELVGPLPFTLSQGVRRTVAFLNGPPPQATSIA